MRIFAGKNTGTKRFTRADAAAYGQILLGCLIGAAAYPWFLTPNAIAPGGLTGVSMILNYAFGLPIGTTSLVLNIPLFLAGYRSMGRAFALRSLIATVLFSLLIDILPLKPVTQDALLGAIFGGALLGIGLGLILRGGATTGGTDMLARLVHKKLSFISVGTFLFAFDAMVILAAWFTIGSAEALYALISIFVSSKAVDLVMIGLSGNKACFIMSERWESISARIMTEMDRGVTQLSARGAYTGKERPVVLCVSNRTEIPALKKIVNEEDENAFMFITEAHEAIGEGFSGMNDPQ